MSMNEVIQLGQEITKPDLGLFSQFNWAISLTVIGLVVVGILFLIWGSGGFSVIRPVIGVLSIIFAIVIFIATITYSFTK